MTNRGWCLTHKIHITLQDTYSRTLHLMRVRPTGVSSNPSLCICDMLQVLHTVVLPNLTPNTA